MKTPWYPNRDTLLGRSYAFAGLHGEDSDDGAAEFQDAASEATGGGDLSVRTVLNRLRIASEPLNGAT